MSVTPITLYHIALPTDLLEIEKIIQRDDEEAFIRLGPYFQEYRGGAYLINAADIGCGACTAIEQMYEPLFGIEITGTAEELDALTCLFDSQNCLACHIGDRCLILPNQDGYSLFVECLKQRVGDVQQERPSPPLSIRKILGRICCWPSFYIQHTSQQEKHARLRGWQSMVAISLIQGAPLLLGILAGAFLFHPFSPGQYLAALLFAYLVGGLGMLCAGPIPLAHRADEDSFEGFPLTDVVVGFLVVGMIQLLIGRF
ncbi:hypothetical protein KSF_106670 [Reticulibacter mediterranei]|uniref:Uncharacterized protein n=1 Tax=Reticulibacter mediterranei TaxID=2778369 RepID=A0A8J3IRE2_9CHLR|nr:hypothetical protein [Reticulibacter mediterranei]GHP00620.1 hypothetical protein KSF_106670 [Reticulibacter mediterranei]